MRRSWLGVLAACLLLGALGTDRTREGGESSRRPRRLSRVRLPGRGTVQGGCLPSGRTTLHRGRLRRDARALHSGESGEKIMRR